MTRACRRCRARFIPKGTGRTQLYCTATCRKLAEKKRRRQPAYFSQVTPEWGTPQDLFDELDAEFGFTFDVCATPENAKCERYFSRSDDALSQIWEGVCWMNPPYGRALDHWMAKAYDTARAGHTVVCLVPARTDTTWWHRFASLGEVRHLRGRVRFTGAADASAPFPSSVVVFRHPFRHPVTGDETGDET